MKVIGILFLVFWLSEQLEIFRQKRRVNRIAAEQRAMKAEQARQAERLDRHEERISNLEQRISAAEAELSFNREQRERLFKLLKVEENQISNYDEGSEEWKKHQQKIIRIESQIHSVQKRIDKAQFSKYTAEKQLAA